MAKLLMIGVDQMIGANLALELAKNFECIGLYDETQVAPAGIHCIPWDGRQPLSLLEAVRDSAPDWVIYCGQTSRSSWDSPADSEIWHNHTEAICQLASECAQRKAALTVISTDAVFVGPRLFHEESCVTTSQTSHARHAREIEDHLRKTHALVVRTHAYGWHPVADGLGYADGLVQMMQSGQTRPSDGVRYATPILVTDLASMLEKAFELNLQGLYHVTGAERTNPYRFACELAAVLGNEDLRSSWLAAHAPPLDADLSAKVAHVTETSLNTRRARRDLGFAMPLLREGIERFAAQASNGHLDRLRAATKSAASARAA